MDQSVVGKIDELDGLVDATGQYDTVIMQRVYGNISYQFAMNRYVLGQLVVKQIDLESQNMKAGVVWERKVLLARFLPS